MVNRGFYLDKYDVSQFKESCEYRQCILILFLSFIENVITIVVSSSIEKNNKLSLTNLILFLSFIENVITIVVSSSIEKNNKLSLTNLIRCDVLQ